MKKLVLLLAVSLTPGICLAAKSIPAPANVSDMAQTYLNRARVGEMPPMGNEQDLEQLLRMRKALGNLFLKNAKRIDPELFITEQAMGDATGYWVNSKKPDTTGQVLLYLHGGGRILGSAQTNLANPLRIARASGIPVVSLEYRLAPEHPYPAGLDDALNAYQWLLDEGYEHEQIGVYGDSAGGGLTLSLAHALKDRGQPLPGALVTLSPVTDVTWEGDSRIVLTNADPVLRSPLSGRYPMWIGDADPEHYLLSPLKGDFTDFPPLLIQVGTRERLLSDSLRLARAARANGVDVTLDVWDGMWHVWQDTPGLPEAEQACKEIAAFFRKHLQ